jgi:hypothetical protein
VIHPLFPNLVAQYGLPHAIKTRLILGQDLHARINNSDKRSEDKKGSFHGKLPLIRGNCTFLIILNRTGFLMFPNTQNWEERVCLGNNTRGGGVAWYGLDFADGFGLTGFCRCSPQKTCHPQFSEKHMSGGELSSLGVGISKNFDRVKCMENILRHATWNLQSSMLWPAFEVQHCLARWQNRSGRVTIWHHFLCRRGSVSTWSPSFHVGWNIGEEDKKFRGEHVDDVDCPEFQVPHKPATSHFEPST